jgi:hypothetical protein
MYRGFAITFRIHGLAWSVEVHGRTHLFQGVGGDGVGTVEPRVEVWLGPCVTWSIQTVATCGSVCI